MKKLLILTAILIVISCKHEEKDDVSYGPCGNINPVGYTTHIKSIIKQHCLSCHAEYAFYDKLNEACNNGTFQQRVLIKRDMPPTGGMDTCDYTILKRWFRNGHYNYY